MMISILSQIVEFRNGESGSHVVNIKRITELLLDRLPMRTNKYTVSGTEQLSYQWLRHSMISAR